MATLLFPGRHLANTRFQEEYLFNVLNRPIETLELIRPDNILSPSGTLDQIIFAITSCNQQHSRYNPVPFHVRSVGVDRFARPLRESMHIDYRIIGIPHFGHSNHFAENTLKEIQEQTEGELALAPQNTIVLCSTPAVIERYLQLGFSVLPAELLSRVPEKYKTKTPLDLVRHLASTPHWQQDSLLRTYLSPATFSVWSDFPQIPRRIQRLYQDPLLNEEGSLTESRDYGAYGSAMSNPVILKIKYEDIKQAIVQGKIVDEGCADGALLVPIAHDFPDSDLIGIEITGEFMAQCSERQRKGEFKGTYTHFHQRNLMETIFHPDSIDTTICNSTTHELWSYGQQEATVRDYLQKKFQQTRRGGRLIIRDVVGPDNKEQEVYMWCNDHDGSNENVFQEYATSSELKDHLDSLSTKARLYRFAQDFLAQERGDRKRDGRTAIQFTEETVQGRQYFVMSLKDAAEFMSKKDYIDNWKSELHEEFTFWSFKEWKDALRTAGFEIIENPNNPKQGSRAYTNPWIVDHRWKGKVELYARKESGLELMKYPVTNVVLVGEKR